MPFKANADRRHHIPKQRYKVTNWAEYDAGVLSALAPICRREVMAGFRSRRFGNSERSGGTTEVKQATTAGWDGLIVAGLEAEEVTELVVASTKPLR